MSGHIFVSYASANKDAADTIVASLEAAGLSCWIAPRNITPGEIYARAIINAIQNSSVFVLVFTKESDESEQVLKEVDRAVNAKIPLLPFRIEDRAPSDAMEYYLCNTHWLDAFSGRMAEKLPELVLACRRHVNAADLPATQDQAPRAAKLVAKAAVTPPPPPTPKRRWRRIGCIILVLLLLMNCARIKKKNARERELNRRRESRPEMMRPDARPPVAPPPSGAIIPEGMVPQPPLLPPEEPLSPEEQETMKRQVDSLSPEMQEFVRALPPILKQHLKQMSPEERWKELMQMKKDADELMGRRENRLERREKRREKFRDRNN